MQKRPRPLQYRFTLPYLIEKYRREPVLRDLFVEGASDRIVINRFAKEKNLRELSVFQIEDVHIPDDIVRPEFGHGNRGRVVALAHHLSTHLPNKLRNVCCIADRDMNCLIPFGQDCNRLWLSDFVCLESYLFTPAFTAHLFGTYFCVPVSEVEIAQVFTVATFSFAIRCAREKIDRSIPWVDIANSVMLAANDNLFFDADHFWLRLLTNQGRQKLIARFKTTVDRFSQVPYQDTRARVHKDDFIGLIAWCAGERGAGHALINIEAIQRVLQSHLMGDVVWQSPLFEKIREWVANNTEELALDVVGN